MHQPCLGRCLVVDREIAQEEERPHVVAEIVRVRRPAKIVSNFPKRATEFFLVHVVHDAGVFLGSIC